MLIILGSTLYVYAKTLESDFDNKQALYIDLASPAVEEREQGWMFEKRGRSGNRG
jgi:hypothetical protein